MFASTRSGLDSFSLEVCRPASSGLDVSELDTRDVSELFAAELDCFGLLDSCRLEFSGSDVSGFDVSGFDVFPFDFFPFDLFPFDLFGPWYLNLSLISASNLSASGDS